MTEKLRTKSWVLAPVSADHVASIERATGLSRVVSRVLAARGVVTAEDAQRFLHPDLSSDWLDPYLIPGMQAAAERVAEAVRAGSRIVVFGDFDLDGISAAAVAARGLAMMGADVTAVVPHRFREGYGLTPEAVKRVLTLSPSLIVTVDCGISAREQVEELRSHGVDVVVTDHHEPSTGVPVGIPVANPKLTAGCPSADLAGAGVALKMVHAVGSLLGMPDVWLSLTDLAALGTVADIVPLMSENRALVAHGIEAVRRGPRAAVAALCAIAGVSVAAFTSDSIGFALAPRLNAAGRMADPAIALELLLCDDAVRCDELARQLDEQNRLRQAVEADLSSAAAALAERAYHGQRALVLAGEGWHEGVKGIVASRLVARYGIPVFLFSIADGVAKGSARSVGAVDLFATTEAASAVLERFGGHHAAVGMSLAAEDLPVFEAAVLRHLDGLPAESFVNELTFDAEVPLDDVSVELGMELSALAPFGHSNRQPLLVVRSVFMNGAERVGKEASHLKFVAFDGASSVPAISFRCQDIEALHAHQGTVDLAFELGVDEWRGRRRAQMVVRDILRESGARPEGVAAELVEDLFARADELLAREEYAGIEEAPSFHTKLAGVTFEGRQERVDALTQGAPLRLERQPENPHDPNAIAAHDVNGHQIGFLNRRLSAVLASAMDAGVDYDVEVSDVTGGDAGRSFGVNVLVSRRDAVMLDVDDSERREAIRERLAHLQGSDLDAELTTRFIGDRALHDAQRDALHALSAGENTLVVMATGRGKSLIFHLHAARLALRAGAVSVFVYPLRALVADQVFHLRETFAEVGIRVLTVTGESSQAERDDAFADMAEGRLDVVLTTPEFLQFHVERFVRAGNVRFVVVDEAHHVGLARAGHRPAYAKLGEACERLGAPTVLAVTATASDDIADQIVASLGITRVILDPTVRDNLTVIDARRASDKDRLIVALASEGGKTVIYVNSRDASVRLARMIRKRIPELGWKTAFYNGGLSRSVRHAVESAFRTGEIQVVVATSAFGEGVNIPDIRNVVLYHLPFNDVEFNQMSGRGGRDGALARIHLLFGEKDARINETILASLAPARDDLAVLYRVLRELSEREGGGFEVTNAELAQRCVALNRDCRIEEKGISSALGIFRDLGFVTSEGHGVYRRLTFTPSENRIELAESVRYTEGLSEIEDFSAFKAWAMSSDEETLLRRFNRPILPTRS
jgi:single-stranded-DNA-specific exonuclease